MRRRLLTARPPSASPKGVTEFPENGVSEFLEPTLHTIEFIGRFAKCDESIPVLLVLPQLAVGDLAATSSIRVTYG